MGNLGQDVHHVLSRTEDGRFYYDNEAIARPAEESELEKVNDDAERIIRFINNYRQFGKTAPHLQRNYFAVMGWLYFAPFMDKLRRERDKLGPGNFDCKPVALVYGPSNCGKTAVAEFLLKSMFGHDPLALGNDEFTSTKVASRQYHAGLYPLFYDDILSKRFAGGGKYGSDGQGESIVKAYDRLQSRLPTVPCLIASLNSGAREFPNEVRKRAFLVDAQTPLPQDDVELVERLTQERKYLHNRVGTQFYAEYLFRMSAMMDELDDWANFDYLAESTGLLATMFRQSLQEEEELPQWCRAITSKEYDDIAWDPKRENIKSTLDGKLYSKFYPPPVGHWTVHGDSVVIGVPDLNKTLRDKDFPDHIIDRVASNGSNLHLWRDQTESFIKRGTGNGQYELPIPSVLIRWLKAR